MLVLMDFAGGMFSLGQMMIDGYNFNDWSSFLGNPTKSGITFVTHLFDIIFIFQHYVCYPHLNSEAENDGYQPLRQNVPRE